MSFLLRLLWTRLSCLSLAPSQGAQNLGRAVASPQCSYPTDSLFRFCQQCRYAKRMSLPLLPQQPLKMDVESIDSQIAHLFNKQSTDERQKSRLLDQLCQFLASLPMPMDKMSASPLELVRFLVWKDKTGKMLDALAGDSGTSLSVPVPSGLLQAPLTPQLASLELSSKKLIGLGTGRKGLALETQLLLC